MIDLAHTVLSPAAIACAVLYALAAARLLCYRPNGARHRHGVSLAASILIAGLSCRSLAIALAVATPSAIELLGAGFLCVLCYAIRGNLATLLRNKDHA